MQFLGIPPSDLKKIRGPLFAMKIMSQLHRKACKLNFHWKICIFFSRTPLARVKHFKGPLFISGPPNKCLWKVPKLTDPTWNVCLPEEQVFQSSEMTFCNLFFPSCTKALVGDIWALSSTYDFITSTLIRRRIGKSSVYEGLRNGLKGHWTTSDSHLCFFFFFFF